MTTNLFDTSYFASYNEPFNEEIYSISGYAGSYFCNYSDDPRALLFKFCILVLVIL